MDEIENGVHRRHTMRRMVEKDAVFETQGGNPRR